MSDEQKTTFDFGDGRGAIPATQHTNPDGSAGGWIAFSASVSTKAFIGICARILGGTIWGGTIWGGTILGGTIEGGTIEGGTILGGTIRGGTIWGGTIEGGTIWGGTIEGGTILGGTIRGGTIRGGTIEGGTIEGGTILGGTIRGGTIEGGTIRGGTIWGGEWKTSPLQIQGSKHFVNMCSHTELQIGCIRLTIAKWRKMRIILGQREGYTAEQIDEYGMYIELAAKFYPPVEDAAPLTNTEAAA